MEVFARYDVVDEHGNKVAEGLKASFCLEDSACDYGVHPKYNCDGYGHQGKTGISLIILSNCISCLQHNHHGNKYTQSIITRPQQTTYTYMHAQSMYTHAYIYPHQENSYCQIPWRQIGNPI